MSITELSSAVHAVMQGVEDKAGEATAEELAYLASATEKIGGAATLTDVVEAGEDAIKAIEQLVSNRTAELTAHGESTQAAVTAHAGTTLDGLKTDADKVRDDALAAVADKRAVLARELDKIQPRPGARALFYNLI